MMILKIIISGFMWIAYLITGISIITVFYFLFRILIWDNLKKRFSFYPYQSKEILEEDPFEKE